MKGFVVTTLTQIGTVGLDQCIQENKIVLSKQSLLDRMKFHKIWIQEIKRNPLSYSMMINPDAERFVFMDPKFSLEKCASEVHVAMIMNGCKKDIDYCVEVSNE